MQTILIVEDHDDARRIMGEIVTEAFGTPLVHDVPTLAHAREKIASNPYDLVVLDLGLPDGNGETFIPEIAHVLPNAYVVVSTIHDESDRLLAALENGAKGYLLKEQPKELLVEEFKGIQKGKPPLAPAVTRRLLEFMRTKAPGTSPAEEKPAPVSLVNEVPPEVLAEDLVNAAKLTEREREILMLLGKGFNRPEIAGILNISKHTVATHVAKVYDKLDIASRSEAALVARQLGLI